MSVQIKYFDSSKAKGGFLGNFSVTISSWNGLTLSGIALIKNQHGKRFIMLPKRNKKGPDGSWVLDYNYIEMPNDVMEDFQKACLAAIDQNATSLNTQVPEMDDSEIPF